MILYIVIVCIILFALYSFWGIKLGMAANGDLAGANLNNAQDVFFRTVFTLLGYVAKRDGPINAKEVKRTEVYMDKMELNATQKREAIRLFKMGAEPQFNADETIKEFHGLAKKRPNLAQILLVYLINLARVDGLLASKEVDALQKVALGLGYSSITCKHLLQMISSQSKCGDGNKTQSSHVADNAQETTSRQANPKHQKRGNTLQMDDESCSQQTQNVNTCNDQWSAAYKVFDVPASAGDEEIKKAYRRLVNHYHPDKFMGKGLPSYTIQSTTKCFQTIQAAYRDIKEARGQ